MNTYLAQAIAELIGKAVKDAIAFETERIRLQKTDDDLDRLDKMITEFSEKALLALRQVDNEQ